MNRRSLVLLLTLSGLGAGCVRFHTGTVAELETFAGLEIIQRARSYGGCFRLIGDVPLVYRVRRDSYELVVAHSADSAAQWYLHAVDARRMSLEIVGTQIHPVRQGSDLRRLQDSRGQVLTHFGLVPALEGRAVLTFEVRADGVRVGTESLSYQINPIRCRYFDGP